MMIFHHFSSFSTLSCTCFTAQAPWRRNSINMWGNFTEKWNEDEITNIVFTELCLHMLVWSNFNQTCVWYFTLPRMAQIFYSPSWCHYGTALYKTIFYDNISQISLSFLKLSLKSCLVTLYCCSIKLNRP